MIRTLQSLRFIFVMMIFMSHFAWQGTGAFDAGGDCGVVFFFVLSGFVLSLNYGRSVDEGRFNHRRFLLRRLWKLYPLHLLCLLAWLAINRPAIGLPVVLNALLLQCWVPDASFYFSCNSVSWFLSDLVFFYLLFPLLRRHATCRGFAFALVFTALVYTLIPIEQLSAVLYVHPLVRWVDFYWGVVLARLYEHVGQREVPAWVGWAIGLLLVALLIAYPVADVRLRNAPLYWLAVCPLLLVAVWREGHSPLRWAPLVALGSLAMPVFMLHQMVIGVLQHLLPAWTYGPLLLLSLGVTLMMSWGVERCFLKPLARVNIIM